MLESNRRRVQNRSGAEIRLFIIARVLSGFGIGILLMIYFPPSAVYWAWPALIVCWALFVVAMNFFCKRPLDQN